MVVDYKVVVVVVVVVVVRVVVDYLADDAKVALL